MEHLKSALIWLLCFPLGVLVYIVYVHIVSFLDPILTIVIGGGFWLAIIAIVIAFIINMKDFIVSIFKKDRVVDKRGFKKL